MAQTEMTETEEVRWSQARQRIEEFERVMNDADGENRDPAWDVDSLRREF